MHLKSCLANTSSSKELLSNNQANFESFLTILVVLITGSIRRHNHELKSLLGEGLKWRKQSEEFVLGGLLLFIHIFTSHKMTDHRSEKRAIHKTYVREPIQVFFTQCV